MAIGWLAVLKSVPWTEVIRNAPKVADAAKKLWKSVVKKSAAEEQPEPVTATKVQSFVAVEVRLAVLEADFSELQAQMFASAELIKTLAEQNTQLVKRIETNRVRTLWLSIVVVIVAIVAALSLR